MWEQRQNRKLIQVQKIPPIAEEGYMCAQPAGSRYFRYFIGAMICGIAILLPYRARAYFNKILSMIIHAPFVMFGIIARYLLRKLSLLRADSHDPNTQ